MVKHGKKYRKVAEQVKDSKLLSATEALAKVKDLAYTKFDESVDVSINLGIDPSKGDQVVRGSVLLPHAKGKQPVVIVFAKGDYAEKAEAAGADFVGAEDLVEKISKGWLDFDFAVSTPDMMGQVGKLAKILGPKGLLPNKKLGTVTFEVTEVIKDLKKGRQFFKNNKSGLINFSIGKVSFDPEKLQQNFAAFMKSLLAAKPASSKGKFLKKVKVSSTMGVGLPVNPDDVAGL